MCVHLATLYHSCLIDGVVKSKKGILTDRRPLLHDFANSDTKMGIQIAYYAHILLSDGRSVHRAYSTFGIIRSVHLPQNTLFQSKF